MALTNTELSMEDRLAEAGLLEEYRSLQRRRQAALNRAYNSEDVSDQYALNVADDCLASMRELERRAKELTTPFCEECEGHPAKVAITSFGREHRLCQWCAARILRHEGYVTAVDQEIIDLLRDSLENDTLIFVTSALKHGLI